MGIENFLDRLAIGNMYGVQQSTPLSGYFANFFSNISCEGWFNTQNNGSSYPQFFNFDNLNYSSNPSVFSFDFSQTSVPQSSGTIWDNSGFQFKFNVMDTYTPSSAASGSSSVSSGRTSQKYWADMTDGEMKQVYGNYSRDITKISNKSAEDLNRYLKGKGKLEGMGEAFKKAEAQYGISATVLVGICMHESGQGKKLAAKNNVAGVRIAGSKKFRNFDSVEACIMEVARFLKEKYVNPPEKGKVAHLTKLYQVNAKYCPSAETNSNAGWAAGVEHFAHEAELA